jgi:hypothetical protein
MPVIANKLITRIASAVDADEQGTAGISISPDGVLTCGSYYATMDLTDMWPPGAGSYTISQLDMHGALNCIRLTLLWDRTDVTVTFAPGEHLITKTGEDVTYVGQTVLDFIYVKGKWMQVT